MSSDDAIVARGVGKSYVLRHAAERSTTMAEALVTWMKNPVVRQTKETFWALNDVSFSIQRGEIVGVVGRNGAGKSTLLKIISRITNPTTGQVDVYGRVGSLLEVGTGFHPELTGRENIYLNGTILGMRRRGIDRRFQEIVDFSGVERFLDTPVKRYSSGMYVRLAFAVAAHLDTDILLVDEVLAVGDAAFQRKCLGKIGQVSRDGRTVVLVSHNMATVAQMATHCLLLETGQLAAIGDTSSVIEQYAANAAVANDDDLSDAARPEQTDLAVRLLRARLTSAQPRLGSEDLHFEVDIDVSQSQSEPRIFVMIHRAGGEVVGAAFSAPTQPLVAGDLATLEVALPDPGLTPGHYYLTLAIGWGDEFGDHSHHDLVTEVLHFEVGAPVVHGSTGKWHPTWGPLRLASPRVVRRP